MSPCRTSLGVPALYIGFSLSAVRNCMGDDFFQFIEVNLIGIVLFGKDFQIVFQL